MSHSNSRSPSWAFALAAAVSVIHCNDGEVAPQDARPTRDVMRDATVDAMTDPLDAAPDARDAGAIDVGLGDSGVDVVQDTAPPRTCPRLAAWTSSAPWGGEPSHPLPSFALGNRFYVHAQQGSTRALYLGSLDADGRIAGFRNVGDHGGGPHGFTAMVVNNDAWHFRNGHIARYRFDGAGALMGDVELIEENADTAFGGNRYVWDVAVAITNRTRVARAVVHLGGFSFAGYTCRPDLFRSPVPLARRFDRAGNFPANRPGNAAFVVTADDAGWIFARENNSSRFFRASVRGAGSPTLGTFEPTTALPMGDGNERGDLFSVGCSLFVIRGSRVFATDVRADGALSGFEAQPSLPEAQIDVHWGEGHQEGASWGIIGNYVLVTGQRRVHVARLLR